MSRSTLGGEDPTALRLPVYLDYNATTPVDGRVFAAMRPYFTEHFGNAASSSHRYGWTAQEAVIAARRQVAGLLHAEIDEQYGSREIVWTSGATETNNLAIKGVAATYATRGKHLITQTTEHKAVLDTCACLETQGFEVTYLPVDRTGRVYPEQVAEAIRPDTILVSVMYANNETGTIQPIRAIGAVCKSRGVFFHSDATQAVGKLPIDVQADGIDLLSLSAHKFYGPKGCGALFVRRHNPWVRPAPQMDGGGHERGMRSGTLNVPGIVGLGEACRIAAQEMVDLNMRTAALRDRLEAGILGGLDRVFINGDRYVRLPHVSNLAFADADGSAILRELDDVAVSSGSACTSAHPEPSHVLRAMGMDNELSLNSIRFSLGRYTNEAQVDHVIRRVVQVVRSLRRPSASCCEGACASPQLD